MILFCILVGRRVNTWKKPVNVNQKSQLTWTGAKLIILRLGALLRDFDLEASPSLGGGRLGREGREVTGCTLPCGNTSYALSFIPKVFVGGHPLKSEPQRFCRPHGANGLFNHFSTIPI